MCKINVIYEHAIHPFIRDQIKVPYRQLQRQSCLSSSLELRASKPIKCPSDVEAKRRILINELQGTARHGRAKHSCTLHIAHCIAHTHSGQKGKSIKKSTREYVRRMVSRQIEQKRRVANVCTMAKKKKKKWQKKAHRTLRIRKYDPLYVFYLFFFFQKLNVEEIKSS